MCSKTLLSPHISTLEHSLQNTEPSPQCPTAAPDRDWSPGPLYPTCTYNILQPHTLTQPQEDPVHMSQAFPMSSYDLRKKKPSLVLLVECQKSGCGVGAAWCLVELVLGWCLSYGFSNGNKEEKYLCRVWAAAGRTRVKIFSVHPVKIFSVHCVRPAAMCLVQNMCNNLAHVTTISKHSAQKTAYIEPQQHT